MPDMIFKTKEEIPAGLQEYAAEKDGAFVVDVAPGVKLKEFRDNNVKYLGERDGYKNKVTAYVAAVGDNLETITAELAELRAIKQKVDDGKLAAPDKIEAAIASRVKASEDGFKAQIAEANTKLSNVTTKAGEYKSKFARAVLRQEITNVVLASDSGANPEALADILACAEQDFEVQDDSKLVRMKNGAVHYGQDGATAEPPKEWLAGLLKQKTYFQKPSAGGGATGGTGTGNFGMSQAEFDKLPPGVRMEMKRKRDAQGQR